MIKFLNPENGQYAIINTLFPRKNVKYELCFSFISYYLESRQTNVAS